MPGLLRRAFYAVQRRVPTALLPTHLITDAAAATVGAATSTRAKEAFMREYDIRWRDAAACAAAKSLRECAQRFGSVNDVFTRKLRPGVLKVQRPHDPAAISAIGDSYCLIFPDYAASKLYLKGKTWTLPRLLGLQQKSFDAQYSDFHIALFRIAVHDYHHMHAPLPLKLLTRKRIAGTLLSVDPSVVRRAAVYDGNQRQVIAAQTGAAGKILMVPVGSTVIGRPVLTAPFHRSLPKGADLGYFEFGGSSVLLLIPKSVPIRWDPKILAASRRGRETKVRVGQHVGTVLRPGQG